MKGMEAMIANMLGITPASMHETLSGFQAMIADTKATLERIEAKQDEIIGNQFDILEGQKNDARDGNDAGGSGVNRSANRGRRRAGSDATGNDAGT